jgi:hypothetical protein
MRDPSPCDRHGVVLMVRWVRNGGHTRGQLFVQVYHCPIGMDFVRFHMAMSHGRPGVAIPMGACGAVENVAGVIGVKTPPDPIVKPATLIEPEFAT